MAQVEALLIEGGVDAQDAALVATEDGAARVQALQVALLAVSIFAVLGLCFTRRLPDQALGGTSSEPLAPAAAGPA